MRPDATEIPVAGDATIPAAAVAMLAVALAACVVVAIGLVGRLRRGVPVIRPRPHTPATWRGADVASIAATFVALLVVAGTVVGTDATPRTLLAADIATKIAATLAGIVILRSGGASWAALGLPGPRWRDDPGIALGGLALVLAPLLVLAAALDRIVPYSHPIVAFLVEHRDPLAVGLVVVAAVLVAPVAEEFFFRRVLLGWLEARFPESDGAAAVGLSAAAFAAAHAGHGLAWFPLLLLGVVLGFIARRTGSLVPCVLLHALFNAVSVGLLLLGAARPAGG